MSNITELIKTALEGSISKGWFEPYYKITRVLSELDPDDNQGLIFHFENAFFGQQMALLQSEASEALEAHRKDRIGNLTDKDLQLLLDTPDEVFTLQYRALVKGTLPEELADIALRLFILCGWQDIDLERHLLMKLRFNQLTKTGSKAY